MHAASGKLVPLSAFAHVERTAGPLTVNQLGQLPAVTISFNLPHGVALGDAVAADRRDQADLGLPTTILDHFLRHRPGVPGRRSANQGLLLWRP